jgi:hypothetical protein
VRARTLQDGHRRAAIISRLLLAPIIRQVRLSFWWCKLVSDVLFVTVGERGTPAQRTPMQHSGGQFSAAAYGGFSSTQAGYASALHFAASPSGASPSMQPRTTPRQSPGASLM